MNAAPPREAGAGPAGQADCSTGFPRRSRPGRACRGRLPGGCGCGHGAGAGRALGRQGTPRGVAGREAAVLGRPGRVGQAGVAGGAGPRPCPLSPARSVGLCSALRLSARTSPRARPPARPLPALASARLSLSPRAPPGSPGSAPSSSRLSSLPLSPRRRPRLSPARALGVPLPLAGSGARRGLASLA